MTSNYAKLISDNLNRLYKNLPEDLSLALNADRKEDSFIFKAFGKVCRISPDGVTMGNDKETGVLGVLISLYALHASPEPCVLQPLKAFKDFSGSMPYVGAFASHAENILVPHVERIEKTKNRIMEHLQGNDAYEIAGGDFSFFARPLPKITLC